MSGEEQIPVPVSELRGHTSASIMVIGMKVFEELASAPDGEHWSESITLSVYRESYFAYLNRRPRGDISSAKL
jgi:hypothetical protein